MSIETDRSLEKVRDYLDELESEVDALTDERDALVDEVEGLRGEIESLESHVEELKEELREKEKGWLLRTPYSSMTLANEWRPKLLHNDLKRITA